jgi:hypothetical protein
VDAVGTRAEQGALLDRNSMITSIGRTIGTAAREGTYDEVPREV